MTITEIADVPAAWTWLGPLLAPAIAVDPERTIEDVFAALREGRMTAYKVSGDDMAGVIVTRVCGATEAPYHDIVWVLYASGQVSGAPGRVKQALRAVMDEIERASRAIGARELRILGRDKWCAVFPEYDVLWQDAGRAEIRKVL